MISLLLPTLFQLTVLVSAHGLHLREAGQLGTCGYPSICQDNCQQGDGHTHCPGPHRDCPCIIKACWTLNGSCVHACDQTLLAACLDCLNSVADKMCGAECSRVCVDAKCEHSQGQCHGCVEGMFGQSCSQECSSVCNGSCYRDTGYCKHCQQRTHGLTCEHTCSDHCHTCWAHNGSCVRCAPGYTGEQCNMPCADGFYGFHCDRKCSQNCARTCDHVFGSCIGGCKPGYFRADCIKTCPPGTYGQDCASECAVTCAKSAVCDHVSGSCTLGCSAGFRGLHCGELCSLGTYGPNCSQNCSENCFFGVCNRFSGHCQRCDDDRAGLFCEYVTHVGRSRTNINDDTMSTDQTILIFLGLFAMGGAMWFLLGTFVYCKQKIVMKKVQQTGQLPKDWTSVVRRYPQYFYNPRLLSKSTDLRRTSGPADAARSLHRREGKRVETLNLHPGYEFTRQYRQGHFKNIQIGGQRKEVQIGGQRKEAQIGGQRKEAQIGGQRKEAQREGLRKIVDTKGQGKNVDMDGRGNHFQMEGQGKNVEMEGQGKNVEMEGQRKSQTAESIENSPAPKKNMGEDKTGSLVKTRRQNFSPLYSPDLWLDRRLDAEKARATTASGQVWVGKRGLGDEKLATMFEMDEHLTQEQVEDKTGKVNRVVSEHDQAESTNSTIDVPVRAIRATTPESVPDGAGDTASITLLGMTVSTTTGLDTKSVLVPRGEKPSPCLTQGEGVHYELLHTGISLQSDALNNRRNPQQERKPVVDGARTSTTQLACPVCGKQCVCSMECQCSVVSTATPHGDRRPAVLLRRAKSSLLHETVDKAHKHLIVEHGLSHTSSSYSYMKAAAVHTKGSRKDRDLFKPPRPLPRANRPRAQRASRSTHTLESSLDTPRVEASVAGDTAGELSDTGTTTSGSTTHQTSKIKTRPSTVTASDSEVTESTSTTIESSAVTQTSGESATSAGPSLSELQHRYFQAALERQSQPYTAKTDMAQPFDEEKADPLAGAHSQIHWLRVQNSQYDNKPLGFFQRSFRNMVGAFNKLMGSVVQPQEVMGTRARAAGAFKTFTPNEALSSQFLIHRLESLRRDREAAVQPHINVTDMTATRHKQTPSRADKVPAADKEGTAETVTERSSAMSNTARTSSRSDREDSTLTDASDIDYSTVTSSQQESVSTTLRSSEASSSEASSSSGTTEESTDKHTSTDVDSTLTRSNSRRHPRSHPPRYSQELLTRRQSSHSRPHRP